LAYKLFAMRNTASLLSLSAKQIVPLLVCLLLISSPSHSQTDEKPVRKIYAQLATGPANHGGYTTNLGVQAVLKNNWTASFSFQHIGANPKNLPADYDPGYTLIIILPIPNPYPEHQANLYSVTGGKCFELGRSVWITTEAGVSLVKGDRFQFTSQPVENSVIYVGPNYKDQSEEQTSVGALLRADLNWAFSSFAGLGIGAFANLNSIQSPVGAEIKLIVGWMNRKPKAKRRH
jgi:hypothetical protein